MKNLVQIILIISTIPSRCEFFNEPVIIRKEGVSIFECWGIALNESIWLMDETGNWHELELKDQNADIVIDAICDKVKNEKAVAA